MLRLLQAIAFLGLIAFALPAYALDCASPDIKKKPTLAAICADPALKTADTDMNNAYQSLYKGRDKDQQQVLKFMQLDWIEDVMQSSTTCMQNDNVDKACLLTNIRSRIEFLNSADGIGPKSQGKLVFKGYFLKQKGDNTPEVKIALYEFEKPDTSGKEAFNKQVENIFADAMKDAPGADDGCNCQLWVSMAPPQQTENFIAATVENWSYGGSGHAYWTRINQFLDSSLPMEFSDLFQEYDASVLAKACFDQLVTIDEDGTDSPTATTGDRLETYRPSNAFMDTFRSPTSWSFDGKVMSVSFSRYVIGNDNDYEPSCDLPYDLLKPHLADGAKLPFDTVAALQ